jgi:hypothetical protein
VLAELRDRVLADVTPADMDAALRVFAALHRAADKTCTGSAPIVEMEGGFIGDLPLD